MTNFLLLVCIFGALALALPRPRLRLPILMIAAVLNLWVYGGTARYSLPDDANTGYLVAATLGLACVGFGMYLHTSDRPLPRWIDEVSAALAMTLPAGLLALWLGDVLSGSAFPLEVHLGLLLCCLVLSGLSFRVRGLWRGATLGMAIWIAMVTLDSMRFGQMLRAETPVGGCLIFGGQATRDPLMGLTVAKPVYWLGDGKWLRWSFRSRGFVWGSGPNDPRCPSP
jgi:hypothetical protein